MEIGKVMSYQEFSPLRRDFLEVFRLELNVKRRAYTFTNREDGARPSGRRNHKLKAQREHAHRTDPRNSEAECSGP